MGFENVAWLLGDYGDHTASWSHMESKKWKTRANSLKEALFLYTIMCLARQSALSTA